MKQKHIEMMGKDLEYVRQYSSLVSWDITRLLRSLDYSSECPLLLLERYANMNLNEEYDHRRLNVAHAPYWSEMTSEWMRASVAQRKWLTQKAVKWFEEN